MVFWVKTIQEFLKFLNQSNHQKNLTRKYLKVIVENKNLAQVLTSCFEISYNTDKQIKECFISTSGVADFDSLINVLKANVLKCFNQFLDLEVLTELEARDVNLGRNSFFLSAHNICIPYVIKSLLLFFKTENLNIEEVHQVLAEY